jgi:hypothetical protein|tara:strand:+ start:2312 stop:2602 length:291 start_codon:yes stop_codon:yes gene_type:complete
MADFIVNTLAIMVLLNFILNLTSVYLGRYKKALLEEYLQHILEHLCPAYEEDEECDDEDHVHFMGFIDDKSELAVKLSKDKASFEMWDTPSGGEEE